MIDLFEIFIIFAGSAAFVFGGWKLVEFFAFTLPERRRNRLRDLKRQQLSDSQPVPSDEQLDELFKDVDFEKVTSLAYITKIASEKLGLGEFPLFERDQTKAHQKLYDYLKERVPEPKPEPLEFPSYYLKDK